jgi:uncharacterized protein
MAASCSATAASRDHPIDEGLERRAIAWFLLIAFIPTWMLWTAMWQRGVTPSDSLHFAIFGTAGMYFPGIAALVAGRFVLHEHLRETTTLLCIGRKRFYIWAWFLFPLIIFATLVLDVVTHRARVDTTFSELSGWLAAAGKTPPSNLESFALGNLMLNLLAGPAIHALTTIGEEVGWRDFLLRRLLRLGHSEWAALIITGIIWGLWHLPVILLGLEYVGHPVQGIPFFVVYTTLVAIIIGWLYLESGSVWVAAVAHASINSVQRAALFFIVGYDGLIAGGLGSALGWIPLAACIGWLAYSGRLPSPFSEARKLDG